jgi:hypothetical protein
LFAFNARLTTSRRFAVADRGGAAAGARFWAWSAAAAAAAAALDGVVALGGLVVGVAAVGVVAIGAGALGVVAIVPPCAALAALAAATAARALAGADSTPLANVFVLGCVAPLELEELGLSATSQIARPATAASNAN